MQLAGKTVVVVGLGRSGVAAARLARAAGARVVATDSQPATQLSPEARNLEATLCAGGHEGVPFDQAELVVVSPGVPPLPQLEHAAAAGVEVIGELELASRFCSTPICCVGGTNGKSTTTLLASRMLEEAGFRVFKGGNLGTPLSEAVGASWDILLVEVSSFQLERAPTFRPQVSVLLNVTEDHLDRYSGLEQYARAKGQAFVNQRGDDTAVIPAGDPLCAAQAMRGAGQLVTFGVSGDYRVAGQELIEQASGIRIATGQLQLHGWHNLLNAAAALAAVRAFGVSVSAAEAGLCSFRALPHRMQFAGRKGGVTFYDDSKGTNVGAAVTALLGLAEARAVLIAGGRDKLGSYTPLARALERKGRAAVLIGEAAPRLARELGTRLPVESAATMSEAVQRAFRLARPGDAVLLSPACASFDMYQDYAERGRSFVAAVESLSSEPESEVEP